VSHPDLQPDGGLPVAPSMLASGAKIFTGGGLQPAPIPRALDLDELPGIVGQFRHAATQAVAAGFDGVELHAAGGYLLDQFMRDGANRRTDRYGGSVANRLRLMLEVTQAVVEIVGAGRVGVRIAPNATHNGIFDSDPERVFSALAAALNDHPLAYLHVIEAVGPDSQPRFDPDVLRKISCHRYMVAMDYDRDRAEHALQTGRADLVAFGRAFIANPDLPRRMAEDIPLAIANPAHFYGGGRPGYTAYPAAP
jgi:N-ethylmaleimide reductase